MHLFRSLTAAALLATGCAAPLTEVAASRESGIGQDLFEEGDQVWITYPVVRNSTALDLE